MTCIFKIAPASLWRAAQEKGVFEGASIDHEDGFIHFSTAEQVSETLSKHFAGQTDLVLVAVDTEGLGDALKWEPSRGGALFPHLYAALKLDAVRYARLIPVDARGEHLLDKVMV